MCANTKQTHRDTYTSTANACHGYVGTYCWEYRLQQQQKHASSVGARLSSMCVCMRIGVSASVSMRVCLCIGRLSLHNVLLHFHPRKYLCTIMQHAWNHHIVSTSFHSAHCPPVLIRAVHQLFGCYGPTNSSEKSHGNAILTIVFSAFVFEKWESRLWNGLKIERIKMSSGFMSSCAFSQFIRSFFFVRNHPNMENGTGIDPHAHMCTRCLYSYLYLYMIRARNHS